MSHVRLPSHVQFAPFHFEGDIFRSALPPPQMVKFPALVFVTHHDELFTLK